MRAVDSCGVMVDEGRVHGEGTWRSASLTRHERLRCRTALIVRLTIAGYTNDDLAAIFNIDVATVKRIRQRATGDEYARAMDC